MPVLSSVHPLCNIDPWQASLPTLRWKDRALQGPRCQSQDGDPWGTYHDRPGCKRSWCHSCQRTCNDLTPTLLHPSTRALPHWILATFLRCLACSSRRIAREVGVHIRTSYRCCWWLCHAALSDEMPRQLAGNKGQATQGGKQSLGRRARGRRKQREPGRGHDDKDRPAIMAWVSRQGAVGRHAVKDGTVTTGQQAADIAVPAGRKLSTDSARSDRALTGYEPESVHHTKKEYARGDGHANRVEGLFSLRKPYLRVLRGVSTCNLPGDVGFFQFLRNFRQRNACEQAELLLQAA